MLLENRIGLRLVCVSTRPGQRKDREMSLNDALRTKKGKRKKGERGREGRKARRKDGRKKPRKEEKKDISAHSRHHAALEFWDTGTAPALWLL